MKDSYYTIKELSYGEYKEKGSKFQSYAFPINNEVEFHLKIQEIKADHIKARHFCYAYELGLDGNNFRINDDGEPSGTAGRPIQGQIHSFGLTNVGVLVVRYFGGTKLGVPGLIHAYKSAANASLLAGEKIEKYVYDKFELNFDYEHMGLVLAALKSEEIELEGKNFDAQPSVTMQIRKSKSMQKINSLKSRLLNISEDRILEDTVIPFCEFKNLEIC